MAAPAAGYTAIQLAKLHGATVFTTVGNDQKAEFCRALGADVVINYRTQNFVAEVQAHTAMRGVDVILDMVGGKNIAQNVTLLTLEGRLVQIAFLKAARSRSSTSCPSCSAG